MQSLVDTGLATSAPLVAGAAAYILYFHRGEHHFNPYGIIQVHFVLAASVAAVLIHYFDTPTAAALKTTASCAGLYLTSLTTCTFAYRLFLNPLNKFPGPISARLSKFSHVYQNRKLKSHHELQKLHQKHGKFVRIGPNDISVTDPDAAKVISGTNSKCYKATWYDNDAPLTSMHTSRSKAQHDARRKVWASAFSPATLKGYETRIQKYNDELLAGLSNSRYAIEGDSEQAINASETFHWYSFDVMGDLAFGKSFGMLESAKTHWAIELLGDGMKPAGLGLPAWFFRFIIKIPGAAKDYWRFISFCNTQIAKRMDEQSSLNAKSRNLEKGESNNRDITHKLIEHFEGMTPDAQKKALPMLQGDSRLIIVAGSDTTAATLTYLSYYLARDPELVRRLRDEIKRCLGNENAEVEHQKIVDSELLNGCIYEALRLNPPVPSGIFRKTPKEGVFVGETFIPGDTTIQMPWFVMGHDEDCYVDAETFMPERWFAKNVDRMVKHRDAWQPFNSGPYGCIGKNLALMQIRVLVVQILQRFDIKLARGENGHNLIENSTDHFTVALAPLRLVFTERA
ncbi:cytochrome P450 [Aaosphaeria arxii CBS 175.79]|uniref:Cytochrome P450 n=1 Tax=Aaosphaeria arxii CBS 175.79 TaxID=1450172 RepID=A0A6A5Y0N4_9PLEO|nr:cytochrome P450 [Aaosphaeria arxii CBS 175.79]KAF2019098.1 cytochrome P450 [Aaosphaeria arxii CBS 175.79]